MKKILCVAPHPDDETLGCGGTLLKHKASGDKIYWLIMTNVSAENGFAPAVVARRQREIERVAKAFGFAKTFKLDFPTTQLDKVSKQKLIKALGDVIHELKPEWIYVPGRYDAHSDHHATFTAVLSTVKTFRAPFVKKVLMYETISETEFAPLSVKTMFVPTNFSDISKYLQKKIIIMKMYRGEMKPHPFPRNPHNIRALATFRGAMAGVKYAESFSVVKEIW